MSLWGNNDGKTASGTIAIAANGTVTGTSTAFTTETRVGDYIRAGGEDYLITAIASNTGNCCCWCAWCDTLCCLIWCIIHTF